MAARFTATFDLRFIDRGAANYLASLRKTETAQAKVARATKLAAGVGATAAKTTQTQATAAKAAAVSTDALAAAQSKASLATKTAAAASAQQATELYRQAAAIKVVDDASGRMQRQLLSAAKASSSAAVALGAQDKAALKAAASTGVLARSGRDADRAFLGAAGRVGDFAKRAGGLALIVGGAGLGLAFKSTLGAAADFDTALREVGAVSDTSGAKLQALGKISRQAGLETGVGATEATKAMAELAKAGLTTAQIGPALKGTLQLAQAGGIATADAASAAANAMNAFGLEAKDTTTIADAFANAANMTTADVGDFAMAMSQGGAAAKLAGLSFEDTTLILAELAKIGVKNSDAGTSLKTAFLQLANPTEKAAGAMDKYRLSFFKANGEVKDAGDISQMLRDRLGGLNKQQRTAVLQTIAGTDGFRTLAAMMNVTGAESDKMRAALLKTGSAADTAKAKQGGYAGAMARLKASFEEVKIAVGTPLLGALSKAADGVAKLVNKMSKAGTFNKVGENVAGFIGALGGKTNITAGQVRGTTTVRGPGGQPRRQATIRNATGAEKAGAVVGAAGAAIGKGVAAAAKVAADAFAKLRPQVAGFVKDVGPFWTNVLKPFLQGFGAGLLATAKVVLTVGVGAFRVLGKVLGTVGSIAGKLGLDKVFRAVGVVVSWFAGGPLAKALGAAIRGTKTFGRLSTVVRAVGVPFRLAASAVGKAGSAIGGALVKVGGAFRSIGATAAAIGGRIGRVVGGAAAAVGSFAIKVGRGIQTAIGWFKRLPGNAVGALKSLPGKLAGAAASIGSKAGAIGKAIVTGIVNAIKAAPGAVVSAIGSIIPKKLRGAVGAVGDFFGLRKGGKARGYFTGGQVPVNLASGELLAFPGGGSAMVPGGVSAYDNVQTAVPAGTRVFTTHGQGLMAEGMSPSMALARQMPNGYVKGGVVKGRVSVFGPPLEGAGRTANGMSSANAGIALNLRPGTEAGWNNATTNKWVQARQKFLVKIGSHSAVLPMIDKGPAGHTGRAIDVTGAGARKLGLNPARFPTDKPGTATLVGRGGVAAARRRVREGTEDTTTSVTTIRNYPKVKNRGGLMESGAAARSGYDMALSGDTFASRKRFGDQFLTELRNAYSEAVASRKSTRDVTVPGVAGATKGTPAKLAKSFAGRLKGTAGGGTKLARLTRAASTAQSIAAKGLPYTYGGGHGRLGVGNPGFDCSGYVSAILGAGGWIKSPMATQQGSGLNTLGTSGAGQFMTWGVRGSSGRNAHTMMKLGNTYWESGSGHGPRRVSGWAGKFAYRHMPGYKRGGKVGSRRPVSPGVLRRAPRAARAVLQRDGADALRPSSPSFVGWGYRRGGQVRGYAGGGVVGRVAGSGSTVGMTPRLRSRIMSQGFDKLDDTIGRLATSRLNALYAEVAKLAAKGGDPKTVNRLRATMDLIDRRLGHRIGRYALAAQKIQEGMDARSTALDQSQRMQGIDPSSSVGIFGQQVTNKADQADIARQRVRITKGIEQAKKMGPRGKDMLDELRTRLGELRTAAEEAAVRQVELARDAVMAQAAEASDTAQRATDAASANIALMEASQRVNRTAETPAAMMARAAGFSVLSDRQEQQAARERANAAAYASIGKTTEAQDALAKAAQLSTDALNSVADAADAARAAQMKAVTDRIDATTFDTSVADLIGDRYQLQGRAAGLTDAALAQQRAEYFNSTVLPLLRRQESDLVTAVAEASRLGETNDERQYRLELEQKRNEILERSLQVQEDIKSNTANRTFGGSLAYEFGGGVYTDLVLDGNGA